MHKKAEIEDLHEGPVCRYAISVAKREFLHFKKLVLELECDRRVLGPGGKGGACSRILP